MSSEMYQEVILDYYRHPRNFGKLEHPDCHARDVNTSCGDEVEIFLKLKNGRIAEARFEGKGCAISQAASSMLTEEIIGKTLEQAREVSKEKVLELLGIEVSGMRMKCALLGLKVLKMAVYQHLGQQYTEFE